MKRLPLSMMLMDTFAGILAILMLVTAGLLIVLAGTNAARGEGAANEPVLIAAGLFVLGGTGFYALKLWVKKTVATSNTNRDA